jgi:hypothetical protein
MEPARGPILQARITECRTVGWYNRLSDYWNLIKGPEP